jgi:multidrug transporter EmrE-like cation transporter
MIWKIVAVIVLRTASDLAFKGAMSRIQLNSIRAIIPALRQALRAPLLWIGFLLGLGNVAMWSSTLQDFDLSYAYPFLSFSFVTIILGGWFFFGEHMDRYKIGGITCITIGSLLLLI